MSAWAWAWAAVRDWLVAVLLALIVPGVVASVLWLGAGAPNPRVCDPSRPLPERVRASHWRWFEGERMADCDADVLVEAADALETCKVEP